MLTGTGRAFSVGLGRAMHLLLTCESLEAAEAERIGLVTEVVADEALADRVAQIAGRLTDCPRLGLKSIKRSLNAACDAAFAGIIRACAEQVSDRPDTWINPTIERLYTELHEAGFAHSVECWRGGELVGGLYGVSLGAAFFGESMFNRAPDASQVSLVQLVERLRSGGYRLLDTQFVTPHLSRFGVVEIPRQESRSLLATAITTRARFPGDATDEELEAFLRTIGRGA